MMELIERQVRGANIVEIHGKLIGSFENCETFHKVFRSLLDKGKNQIIVDLENTPWANSQGIGMLIGAHTSVSNAGGRLVLARVNDRIRDVLAVTKLNLVFKTFHSESTAVQYLTERPQSHPSDQPPMAT
jgi:anti-sigma B factor antagonist